MLGRLGSIEPHLANLALHNPLSSLTHDEDLGFFGFFEADSVETASNLPMPLFLLPFFGSGFVPTASMPDPLRWFADNQPFTPIIETLRRLLLGGEVGTAGLVAVAWCVAITLVGYLWAQKLYERDPAR